MKWVMTIQKLADCFTRAGEDDDFPLYLVNDVGIIKSTEKAPHDELIESHDTIKSLHSALCDARGTTVTGSC